MAELIGVGLVTGGSRGIGRNIALGLTAAGMRVAVLARTAEQVGQTARESGGLGVVADVSQRDEVEEAVERVERELGPIDLLVNNAGIGLLERSAWEVDPADWWHVFEVNLLGTFLCCWAVVPRMIVRGRGRIVNVGSAASYLAGQRATARGASKAALGRFGETLAEQLKAHGIPVFTMRPGLVRTQITEAEFPEETPWTAPELAPRLVCELASGRLDALTGRYIDVEDDVHDLAARADEIVEGDLQAIRLRR
jgi:NAD(P)-dependent dehydrogenase (short-subunit alcohol dehydrogenase family)